MKRTYREKKAALKQQLKAYEKGLTLTKKERRLLHDWVHSGNSPYTNYLIYYDDQNVEHLDFISALRLVAEHEKHQDSDKTISDISEDLPF